MMRSKKYFELLDQRLSAYTAEVPDGPWPPSQRAIDAGCRAFAGRATAGIAAGHDVLVTDWSTTRTERTFVERLLRRPAPEPRESFAIDIYSPASAPEEWSPELDRASTQLGLSLSDVIAWCEPLDINWMPPLLAERAGGWFSGNYDRYSPNGLPD